ncbi:protein O-GlcNAcase [Microbacterium sp. STN6]|uniref:protein O-GlcNAcase n=1 Tax=Microbacterium sp. STN6 TaxID=2995588 RepID=UPI002261034A|nr:protein O-GlcNAcase [Microbacterium sp. STN6]MCX7522828.1 protein O-GlcNAcase [Microbacterium sp. STN6]
MSTAQTPSTALNWRGLVEGFYGAPWSTEERREFFRFAERVGLNRYVYAPKDDVYHRERWHEPYPAKELAAIGELVTDAAAHGVTFVYTIAPALSIVFSSDSEHAALAAKAEQLYSVGVRSFALLFDDVPTDLVNPDDLARFGDGEAGAGLAHGDACARFQEDFLTPHGITEPVIVCPTDYAGTAPSAYRDALARSLPADALVFWTGPDIVVGEITREDIDDAAASYGRDLLLWDNFPVNDFDRSRLFLGPLTGRTRDVAGSRLLGIAANPMVESAPSYFALASIAEWAADPASYDADAAAARALTTVAGPAAHALAPLVAVCSAWPPSAPQSPRFTQLIAAALAGGEPELAELESAFAALSAANADAAPAPLRDGLAPWLRAARDVAAAGVRACALLRLVRRDELGDAELADERELLREKWRAAEAHYANVLRSTAFDFVVAVLASAGGDEVIGAEAIAAVTVLTGPNPAPGDRELAEHLTATGHEVTLATELSGSPDLVIVTRGASEQAAVAAASAAVPLLAWGHLVALGLASQSQVPLQVEAIDIVDASHPLAAGLDGRVDVYRGPSKVTWGQPGQDAVVVARVPDEGKRTLDEGKPAIAYYDTGARLVSGSPAPAPRIAFFLGADGFAPWLVTPAARALTDAAVSLLLAPDAVRAPAPALVD